MHDVSRLKRIRRFFLPDLNSFHLQTFTLTEGGIRCELCGMVTTEPAAVQLKICPECRVIHDFLTIDLRYALCCRRFAYLFSVLVLMNGANFLFDLWAGNWFWLMSMACMVWMWSNVKSHWETWVKLRPVYRRVMRVIT